MNAVHSATTESAFPAAPWPRVKLGEVCEVAAGDSAPQDKALFTGGTIPFVRTSDVGAIHFGVLHDSRDHLTERGATGLRRFRPGSILFPKSGASTFLDHRVLLEVKACVASHLAVISPNPVLDSRYLLFALSQVKARDLLQDSSYPALRASEIEQISLPIPPLPVQRDIVARLDAGLARADRMREQFLALAESAAARFRAILAETFEQGENGDSGNTWPRVQLSKVCDFIYGFPFDSSSFNTEGIGSKLIRIRDVVPGDSSTYTTQNAPVQYAVHDGDLLVGMDGDFNVARWRGGDAVLNQRVCMFRPNEQILLAGFLYYSLGHILSEIWEKKGFSTVKHLLNSDLQAVSLPLPPLPVQRSIVARLDAARADCGRIEELARKGAKGCVALRAALLKEAFE